MRLRTKLSLAIASTVAVALAGFAGVLLDAKRTELRADIAAAAQSFAELSSTPVAKNYELYGQSGFLRLREFTRELVARQQAVDELEVISYAGEILYSSKDESPWRERPRVVSEAVLERVQRVTPSFASPDGRELREEEIRRETVGDIIVPYLDETQNHTISLRYRVTYDTLLAREISTLVEILSLAVLGILAGTAVALWISRRITSPIEALGQGAREIARGNLEHRIDVTSRDEVGELTENFNDMARDLDRSRHELAERERFKKEVELATKLQQDLIPREIPTVAGFDIAASLTPAEEVAGDLYDFIPLPDGRLLAIIGDVTGHGIAAGVVSTITNALSTALSLDAGADLPAFARRINDVLYKKTASKTFITAIFALIDGVKGEVELLSLGHDPALWTDGEVVERLPKGRAPALGMFPALPSKLASEVREVKFGEILLLYTDGLPESWNNRSELYTLDRVENSLRARKNFESAESTLAQILHDAESFRHGFPQKDDLTSILIRRV